MKTAADSAIAHSPELVIITGLSGSGKGTVLKTLEDLGYYSVDNLPIELVDKFAELTQSSPQIRAAALVVDIREGAALERFPALYEKLRKKIPTRLIFLEADDATIIRRFSETRRPHPLGDGDDTVAQSVRKERKELTRIRELADIIVNTSKFNVHDLRAWIQDKLRGGIGSDQPILIYITSFGYRHGVPVDTDLMFDVRFLPNPNYIPEYKQLTGKNPKVAKFIRSFTQTGEFINRISDLLTYLLPHYIEEGKSYLTISFGCTGGHHRSVMMAEDIAKHLIKAGYNVKIVHRDITKAV